MDDKFKRNEMYNIVVFGYSVQNDWNPSKYLVRVECTEEQYRQGFHGDAAAKLANGAGFVSFNHTNELFMVDNLDSLYQELGFDEFDWELVQVIRI